MNISAFSYSYSYEHTINRYEFVVKRSLFLNKYLTNERNTKKGRNRGKTLGVGKNAQKCTKKSKKMIDQHSQREENNRNWARYSRKTDKNDENAQKKGNKHRIFFENEHASCVLRSSSLTTHTNSPAWLIFLNSISHDWHKYPKRTKPRKNVKHRQKQHKLKRSKKNRKKWSTITPTKKWTKNKTERENREKRMKMMKKTPKWGKRRELFENEQASGALRASPSIIYSGPYVRTQARIWAITKTGRDSTE